MRIRQARNFRKNPTDAEKRLDGLGHSYDLKREDDLDREIELYEKGVRILRFSHSDVSESLDGVLNSIIFTIDPEKSLLAEPAVSKPSPPSFP